jgi:predicted adenylyl cyclase CyaB
METEAGLIISSSDPSTIAEKIACLDRINTYRLIRLPARHIRDIYFDNLQRELEKLRLVLRIRQVNGVHLITFKGVSDIIDQSVSTRTEIELPWSERSIHKISEILADHKIRIRSGIWDIERLDPISYMGSLEFQVIQDRETYRKPSSVIQNSNDKVLAELSVDFVTYHFKDQNVRFYNIEIEAKIKDAISTIECITNKLIEMYAPSLRIWSYSKVATGKAIERLLLSDHTKDFINENRELTAAGYDRILQLLRTQYA